jgi:hypothetical protein
MAIPVTSRNSVEGLIGRVPAFAMHTATVYIFAVHVSPWLVGRWFAWILPILQISTVTSAADWYLQHLELVSTFPALVAGYFVARRPDSLATWAWSIPTVVLAYKMLRYQAPSSVLVGASMSALRYFFEIERVMPTMRYATPSDPVRVLAQMTITAPFYAGVAYSFGAWVSKRELLTKLFSFRRSEE